MKHDRLELLDENNPSQGEAIMGTDSLKLDSWWLEEDQVIIIFFFLSSPPFLIFNCLEGVIPMIATCSATRLTGVEPDVVL